MAAQTIQDVIIPAQTPTALTSTGRVLVQNKNVRSGIKVQDVTGIKEVALYDYVTVDGNATVTSPSWGATIVSVSEISAFTAATSVDVANVDVAYVGTTNPKLAYTVAPVGASGYTETWTAPTGGSLLTINPDGSVTFNTAGSASLRLTLTNANTTTVQDTTTSFTIQPMSISLGAINDGVIGSTVSMDVTTVPSTLPVGALVTYSSSNPLVASVNSLGVVTRNTLGDFTITATLSFRSGVFTSSQEATVVAPAEGDIFMNMLTIAPEVVFTESGGRLYDNQSPALLVVDPNTSPLEYNFPTLTSGRDWPYTAYSQAITQPYFDSLSTSAANTGYWLYAGPGVSQNNGPGGYTNLRTPNDWSLMALYNVQGAAFIVGPTSTISGVQLNGVWRRYHMTATIPAGCTQVRFYIARKDAGNCVYGIVPVTPGTVVTFSVFRRNLSSNYQFALANATVGALTKPPLRTTSYGGGTMQVPVPLGYNQITTFTLTDDNTVNSVTPGGVYNVPASPFHWGANKIEQFRLGTV